MADYVLDFVGPGALLAEKAAIRAGLNATTSQTALAATIVGRDQTFAARTQAQAAATSAELHAMSLAALDNNYDTLSAGEAATVAGERFTVFEGGSVKFYRRKSVGSDEFVFGPYASLTGAQTLSGKVLSGSQRIHTNGNRFGITSESAPMSVVRALVHIENNDNALSNGLLVTSAWEGSTGSPFVNNDTTLFETYNKTLSDSDNFSWSVSAPNAYHFIPFGTRDGGIRHAGLFWATSVHGKPGYVHAGTLATQIGCWGRAGFQGPETPATAVVEYAVGTRGEIVNESVGTTIIYSVAVEGFNSASAGNTLTSIGVYGFASDGTSANWSFLGAAGRLWNIQQALFGPGAGPGPFTEMPSYVCSRETGPAIEFGFPSAGGYGSSLGATAGSGFPYLGLNAEADPSGNTYRTRGIKGVVLYNDLNGGLVVARIPSANAAGQAVAQSAYWDDSGNLLLNHNLTVGATTFFGSTVRQAGSRIAIREPGNNIEFGHPDTGGYGSTIGATNSSGFSFLAFNAEVDPSGNTFRTRGRLGTLIYNDLSGSTIFARLPDANASGQAPVECARITPIGQFAASNSIKPASYTVGTVPSASAHGPGAMIYVSNDAGGAVPAFSDGTNWLRVTDRAVIS